MVRPRQQCIQARPGLIGSGQGRSASKPGGRLRWRWDPPSLRPAWTARCSESSISLHRSSTKRARSNWPGRSEPSARVVAQKLHRRDRFDAHRSPAPLGIERGPASARPDDVVAPLSMEQRNKIFRAIHLLGQASARGGGFFFFFFFFFFARRSARLREPSALVAI